MKIAGWVLVVLGCFVMIGAGQFASSPEAIGSGEINLLVQVGLAVFLVVAGIALVRRKPTPS